MGRRVQNKPKEVIKNSYRGNTNNGSNRRRSKNKPKRKIKNSPKLTLKKALFTLVAGSLIFAKYKDINNQSVYTFVETKDLKKDAYDGIPVYAAEDSDSPAYLLEEGTIGIVEEKVKGKNLYKVTFLTESEGIQEGYINSKYLDKFKTLKGDDLENYTKYYTVKPDKGVNIRNAPNLAGKNITTSIPQDTYVLGSEILTASSDNAFSWVPVIYINEENEVIQGYIVKDYLQEESIGEIETLQISSSSTVELKEDHSEDSDEVVELENGVELYSLSNSNEITQDGITWQYVFYYNEETNEYVSGWVNSENIEPTVIDSKEQETDSENTETTIKKVDTSNVGSIDLNVRSGKGTNYEKIGSIPNEEKVTVIEEGSDGWVKIEYTDEETGTLEEGWVSKAYLVDTETYYEKQVDTSSANNATLKLRTSPTTSSTIIEELPNDTLLYVSSAELESTTEEDGYDWVKVELKDGTEGYVASEYLVDYEEPELNSDNISIDVTDENVIGIDVSHFVSTELLEQLLSGEVTLTDTIDTSYYDSNGNYVENMGTLDLSAYSDKSIKYVYIRIGASGTSKLNPFEDSKYKDFSEICEKYNVPFGYYYYSTSVTEEEAETEAKQIKLLLESVKGKYEYCLLPFTVDVETNSKQEGHDVTETKAYLTNLIEAFCGKTILYTSRNATTTGEKILDISEYNDLLESGSSDIWFVCPEGQSSHINSLNEITENEEAQVIIKQIVLDGIINNNKIDINVMSKEAYEKYINGSYINLSAKYREGNEKLNAEQENR